MALSNLFNSGEKDWNTSQLTAPTLDWDTFRNTIAPSLYSGDPRSLLAQRDQWADQLGWDVGGKGNFRIEGLDRDQFFAQRAGNINQGYGDNAGSETLSAMGDAMANPENQQAWRAAVDKALADPNTIYQVMGDRLTNVDGSAASNEGARRVARYTLDDGKLVPIGQYDSDRKSSWNEFRDSGFLEAAAAMLGAGYLSGGLGAAGAGGEAAGTGLVAGTGTTGLQAGLGSGLTLAAPTGTGAGFAAGTGASTIGAGIGASIPALPLAGQGGTGASYGFGGGDLGGGTGSGLSTGSSGGSSLIPKTPQSASSYSLGGPGASLTPSSSGSGSGFQSFMDSVFNTNQGFTGFMNSPGYRIGSGLMQLFNAQDNNDMYRKLREMYGPNSAYAQQLRKQLERKDAASGRRSQYGPREVELQARLADMYSRNYPNMAAAQNARNMGYGQGLGLIMSGLGKTGALDSAWKGLTGLFGG